MQVQLGTDVAPNSETVSAVGGKQSGVSFLSNLPCRSMTHTCGKVISGKGAVYIAIGGVIYGYASQPLQTRQKTNDSARD